MIERGTDQHDFDSVPDRAAAEPVVGEVIALRQFAVDHGAVLRGLTYGQPALDGVNVACCYFEERAGHRADGVPAHGCSCGFYAYDWPRTWLSGTTGRMLAPHTGLRAVTAVVALHGKVIVCQAGLKAQKMRVVAVSGWGLGLGLPEYADFTARFHANYPDVAVYATEEEMLLAHPLSTLSSAARDVAAGRPVRQPAWPVAAAGNAWATTQQPLTGVRVIGDSIRNAAFWAALLVGVALCAHLPVGIIAAGAIPSLICTPLLRLGASGRALLAGVTCSLALSLPFLWAGPRLAPVQSSGAVIALVTLMGVAVYQLVSVVFRRRSSDYTLVMIAPTTRTTYRPMTYNMVAKVEGSGVRPVGITYDVLAQDPPSTPGSESGREKENPHG